MDKKQLEFPEARDNTQREAIIKVASEHVRNSSDKNFSDDRKVSECVFLMASKKE